MLCWSTVATAFKLALRHLSPAQLLLVAALVSWAFLGSYLLISGRWHKLRALQPLDYLKSLALGALNPALYYLVLFEAYHRLPAQEAQAINYTWALTLSLLAVPLLGHRLQLRDLLAGLLCYGGVLVIATRGTPWMLEFANPVGVALALGSTLIWAFFWLFNTRSDSDPLVALFLNFTSGVPLVLVYCFWAGELSDLAWAGLPAAFYVGLLEMGLSFVLWLQAMRRARHTAGVANLIFLSPVLSLVFIALVLEEPLLVSTFLGLGLILCGLGLQAQGRQNRTDS